jgi:hypothetical protein
MEIGLHKGRDTYHTGLSVYRIREVFLSSLKCSFLDCFPVWLGFHLVAPLPLTLIWLSLFPLASLSSHRSLLLPTFFFDSSGDICSLKAADESPLAKLGLLADRVQASSLRNVAENMLSLVVTLLI